MKTFILTLLLATFPLFAISADLPKKGQPKAEKSVKKAPVAKKTKKHVPAAK